MIPSNIINLEALPRLLDTFYQIVTNNTIALKTINSNETFIIDSFLKKRWIIIMILS